MRMTLSTHRMIDIVSTGQVMRGAEITSYRVTHEPPDPHIEPRNHARSVHTHQRRDETTPAPSGAGVAVELVADQAS
ncbi:hypothetical protein TPCV2_01890 [Cutibacterium avidum]|nr:hypothetical protein TPCV4_08300 [Cutibacterium avidum]